MPDPFSKELADPALAARCAQVSRRFAQLFAERNQQAPPALSAHRFGLGPAAVARAARAHSFPDRLADLGVRVTRGELTDPPAELVVDASAPGALVSSALATRAAHAAPARLRAGPRAEPWLATSRAALEPLLEAGDVVLTSSGEPAADALIIGGAARARVSVAPYYYSAGDLERMALLVALELAEPSPDAQGGVCLCLPRGWEQRELFVERVAALGAKLGPRAAELTHETFEASGVLACLDAVAERATEGALGLFVYPMWRERPAVERRLAELTAREALTVLNGTPSLAWARGLGASRGRRVLDVDQRLVPSARGGAARRRAAYELSPSLPRAVGAMLSAWTGL